MVCHDIDGHTFAIIENDEMVVLCQREYLTTGRRGFWVVLDPKHWVKLDRDQYQHDIIERARMGHYDVK